MSSNAKIGIFAVLVLLIGFGAYVLTPKSENEQTESPVTENTEQQPIGQPAPAAVVLPSGSATTDAALAQDAAAVNTQVTAVDAANTTMNQSDQAVAQSY